MTAPTAETYGLRLAGEYHRLSSRCTPEDCPGVAECSYAEGLDLAAFTSLAEGIGANERRLDEHRTEWQRKFTMLEIRLRVVERQRDILGATVVDYARGRASGEGDARDALTAVAIEGFGKILPAPVVQDADGTLDLDAIAERADRSRRNANQTRLDTEISCVDVPALIAEVRRLRGEA